MESIKFDEKFIQEINLDESYRNEYAQAIRYENTEDYKMAGDRYYLAGKIAQEEANVWKNIATDMEYDECRSAITNLSSYYYEKAREFFSKSFNDLCLYGESKDNLISIFALAKSYLQGIKFPMDHSKAIQLLIHAAEKGHKPSMYELGHCYFEGLGAKKDLNKAFKWFLWAAKNGYEPALSMLENYYNHDWGKTLFKEEDQKGDLSYLVGNFYLGPKKKKWDKALDLLFYAANLGSIQAMRQLAIGYRFGDEPFSKDYSKAFLFYSLASKNGDNFSMQQLGNCYFVGLGVEKNLTEAFQWFEHAVKNGNSHSLISLGLCYEKGMGISQNYAKAIDLYKQADGKGISEASFRLGECYLNGIGTEKNHKNAISFYLKAARQGSEEAMEALGKLYAEQRNNSFNDDLMPTFAFFQEEANKGRIEAIYLLALCYEYGMGVSKDISEAILLYWEASKKGHRKARQNLESFEKKSKHEAHRAYMSGYGYKNNAEVFQDHKLAAMCFLEAAQKGSAPAMYQLGLLYENGDGVIKDEELAKKWYYNAAEKHYSKALRKLNKDSFLLAYVEEDDKANNENLLKEIPSKVRNEKFRVQLEKKAKIEEIKVKVLLKQLLTD